MAMMALALSACKTTEANYRAAYEKAMEKDRAGVDSTVYARIRQEARPQKVIIGSDTLAMRGEYVVLTAGMDQNPELFRTYNIVTGQFKQLFTAKNMRKRLNDAGFDSAIVVQTKEPLYYVIAMSVGTPAEASAALVKVKDSGFPLRDPFPWVLRKL